MANGQPVRENRIVWAGLGPTDGTRVHKLIRRTAGEASFAKPFRGRGENLPTNPHPSRSTMAVLAVGTSMTLKLFLCALMLLDWTLCRQSL